MNMQDNELDDLFRSKLGGLEVEPAAHVWANIKAELGGEKKKSWTPVLSMAATILVLLTAGTWFLLKEPAKEQQNQVSRIKVSPKATGNVESNQLQNIKPKTIETQAQQPAEHKIGVVNNIARIKHAPVNKTVATAQHGGANENIIASPTQSNAQVLAVVQDRPVLHAVVPEMSLTGEDVSEMPADVKPVNAAVPAVMAREPEKKVKKRGIHSLGGLINAVIAKVDKREDKLIEFTETDDDQANVTGINLGLIKIKKDK